MPEKLSATFYFKLPKNSGRYTIKAWQGVDYDTAQTYVETNDIGRRVIDKTLKPLYLRRAKKLDEVTVTASRVKFFYKGDTLVYNADAFNLPEGSMLDELLWAIGAKVDGNGNITHQGKRVDELLLNGKNFFGRNKKLVMENMGSYIIDQLKFYNKSGEMSRIAGRKIAGDERYTLDVRLKKEYAKGTLLNLEGGGGSGDLYLGRLFGMMFTDDVSVTLIGNINNLNSRSKPGQSDAFMGPQTNDRNMRNKTGAIDYRIEKSRKQWALGGTVELSHMDTRYETETRSTWFMPTGNTFNASSGRDRTKQLRIWTQHQLDIRKETYSLSLNPRLAYGRNNNEMTSNSATYDESGLDAMGLDQAIRNIHTSQLSADSLRTYLINRSINASQGKSQSLNTGIDASMTLKIPKTPDAISISTQTNYSTMSNDRNAVYDIEYGDGSADTNRRQHQRTRPNHNASNIVRVMYSPTIRFNNRSVSSSIEYENHLNISKQNSELFLLRERAERELVYGLAATDWESVLDPQNSQFTENHTMKNLLKLTTNWLFRKVNFRVGLDGSLDNERLHFRKDMTDTTVTRQKAYLEPSILLSAYLGKVSLSTQYDYRTFLPSIYMSVNNRDTSNPLVITETNEHLKNETSHSMSAYASTQKGKTGHSLSVSGRIYRNSITQGYTFNEQTGVRTYKPLNLNGNWNIAPSYSLGSTLGSNQQIRINNDLRYTYSRGVDLVGVNNAEAQKSVINNQFVSDRLWATAYFGRNNLTVTGSYQWRHTSSLRENFVPFTAGDFSLGAKGTIWLPASFTLETDLTLYTRHGYTVANMNTTDLLWNLRLSRTFFKGKLVLMADGFDILHQLSSVRYDVNAQGRTETYANVVPRYVMVHAQLRLNYAPKKRTTISEANQAK